MKRGRSLLIMVALPAAVSLAVTLLVLTFWDSQKPPDQRVVILPTHSGTALIVSRPTQAASGGESAAPISPSDATSSSDQPPAEGCENPTHVVAAGETLGAIAGQYGMSIDDVIAINQSIDPTFNADILSVGQTLVIPVCGAPTLAPIPTASDTLVPTRDIPTPIATATELPPGTISVEIVRVLNIGDITREAVEIVNNGSPVDLKDWTLSDDAGHEFTFPAFRLFTGGGVTVYSGVGQDTPIKLYWGLTEPLWEIGDTIVLRDSDGATQAELAIVKQ